MINKKILISESINLNLQKQFVSKYTTTTLVNNFYEKEQALFFKSDKGELLDLYLQNFIVNSCQSENNLWVETETVKVCCRKFEEIVNNQIIKLPRGKPQKKIRLVDALIDKRKNYLKFNTMNLKTLSSILNFAFQSNKKNRRSYESVGGLYPIYLYLYVINVENLDPGFYQYQPFHQSLKPISLEKIDICQLGPFSQIINQTGSVILFYVYNSYVNRFKFANQSLVLASFETGMMMQNLQLLSYEFNFKLSHSTVFYPDIILKKLKIADYYGQYLLNVSTVGPHNNE